MLLVTLGMHADIISYNEALSPADAAICQLLAATIDNELAEAENKIWHAHPVVPGGQSHRRLQ